MKKIARLQTKKHLWFTQSLEQDWHSLNRRKEILVRVFASTVQKYYNMNVYMYSNVNGLHLYYTPTYARRSSRLLHHTRFYLLTCVHVHALYTHTGTRGDDIINDDYCCSFLNLYFTFFLDKKPARVSSLPYVHPLPHTQTLYKWESKLIAAII